MPTDTDNNLVYLYKFLNPGLVICLCSVINMTYMDIIQVRQFCVEWFDIDINKIDIPTAARMANVVNKSPEFKAWVIKKYG